MVYESCGGVTIDIKVNRAIENTTLFIREGD